MKNNYYQILETGVVIFTKEQAMPIRVYPTKYWCRYTSLTYDVIVHELEISAVSNNISYYYTLPEVIPLISIYALRIVTD